MRKLIAVIALCLLTFPASLPDHIEVADSHHY